MRKLLLCCWSLLFTRAAVAATAPRVEIPVLNEAAVSALDSGAYGAPRCHFVDIERGTGGVLLQGDTRNLPAGRYRLHARLALAPLGDVAVSAINITVSVGSERRTVGVLHFAAPDNFLDVPVDFTSDGAAAQPVSVAWSLADEEARKNRLRALDPAKIDPDKDDAAIEDGAEPFTVAPDGTVLETDLRKIKYHLAARIVYLESLGSAGIRSISTDKIVYRPGEKGTVTAEVENYISKPISTDLHLELLYGLDRQAPIAPETVKLEPLARRSVTVPLPLNDVYWGATLRASVGTSLPVEATFAVSRNFWETAIVSGIMHTVDYDDPQVADAKAQEWHRAGYTAFESGFWAPDEFGDFTPEKPHYLSGQTQYRESVAGTKNIIAAAHRHGIAAVLYANLWGGDGEAGYDMLRHHPDWFVANNFSTDWLEMWPLAEAGKVPLIGLFCATGVNPANSHEALKAHAATLIASHEKFGWDATRYDSYYSNDWTKMATAAVRRQVEQAVPDYRWGYNTLIPNDVKVNALDIMVGGGGLAMEEAIRAVAKTSGSIAAYADRVLTYRDLVWPHGGHFTVCYDTPQKDNRRVAVDDLYLSSIILASGCHPFYSALEGEVGEHARFALRYAEILFNNKMRPLAHPDAVVQFPGAPPLLEWQRMARTLSLGGNRHRLILHLLQKPTDDATLHNFAYKLPPPVHEQTVSIKMPAGAAYNAAWSLGATPRVHQEPLRWQLKGQTLTLTVPEVRLWNVVVVDYTAPEAIQ